MPSTGEQIASATQTILEELGFESVFIVDVRIAGKKIEAFLDSDTGITFEICQKVSRKLEEWIDQSGSFGEDYLLEVSSPGLDRPLMLPRQFIKNIGRTVKVSQNNVKDIEGILKEAGEDYFVLETEEVIKEKNKKIKNINNIRLPYNEGIKVTIKIKF